MGLLDSLFNPATYQGSQTGLLDFLQSPAMGQFPAVQGFGASPMPVGNYQMPRIGQAESFQPNPAEIPQNAQPTQGVAPLPQENRFLAALNGFANGGGLLPAIADAAQGLAGTPNQTEQALISKGIEPAFARSIVQDPALLRAVLPNVMGMGGQTDDIKEYMFAKKENPSLTFEKFMSQKKSVSGEYGLQGIWGVGKDGKPALVQLGKNGQAIQSGLPEGFTPAKDPIKIDAGTHYVLIDPQSRQPIGQPIPKDIAGAEKAKTVGGAQGEAAAKIPAALIDAEETVKKVDQLLQHPGLDSIVGPIDQYRRGVFLGSEGNSALARLEQLQGGAFLQAYATLKGGGAITEIEGAKAEKAIARMQRSQSEADFREALTDFKDALSVGVRKLKAAAGETSAPAPANATASALKKKYGLD